MVQILKGGDTEAFAQYWDVEKKPDVLIHVPSDHTDSKTIIPLVPNDNEKILVVLEPNTEALIFEQGKGSFTVDIIVGENAALKYYAHGNSVHVNRSAHLGNDARIDWVDVSLNGAKTNVISYLEGTGSAAEYRSLFLGVDNERYDVKSSMVHLGDQSTSNMLTRAAMLGKSKGTYEGLIKIDVNAKGCDAYQKEDTLLLSADARMDATPNLEISNEDVKCSHGVSLGQVDDEKLFYFLSRGISRNRAVKLIVQGFFDEILQTMGDRADKIRDQIVSRLEVVA